MLRPLLRHVLLPFYYLFKQLSHLSLSTFSNSRSEAPTLVTIVSLLRHLQFLSRLQETPPSPTSASPSVTVAGIFNRALLFGLGFFGFEEDVCRRRERRGFLKISLGGDGTSQTTMSPQVLQQHMPLYRLLVSFGEKLKDIQIRECKAWGMFARLLPGWLEKLKNRQIEANMPSISRLDGLEKQQHAL